MVGNMMGRHISKNVIFFEKRWRESVLTPKKFANFAVYYIVLNYEQRIKSHH